ncbi:uncharacterized protein LOC122792496 [Protopterus annectens]|uniref:uncharacterized protein LOC122792496 n=1 Tax=Protopterus annectens TaxID=7888 RepID=UPI001CFB5E83|nr:uncharacterized protein LOC122792496 [Protopterus annectens]
MFRWLQRQKESKLDFVALATCKIMGLNGLPPEVYLQECVVSYSLNIRTSSACLLLTPGASNSRRKDEQRELIQKRLREGVVKDLERVARKQENQQLVEQQIALTRMLEKERDKELSQQKQDS